MYGLSGIVNGFKTLTNKLGYSSSLKQQGASNGQNDLKIEDDWEELEAPQNYVQDQGTIVSDIASQSFTAEIQNDQEVALEYLSKTPSDDLDRAGIEVYKRALTIIGSGDMKIVTTNGTAKSASENLLPNVSYLSHGARVLIELPKGEGNDGLFNWLTSGNKEVNGTSIAKTQKEAIADGKYVYNRYAATHGISISDNGTVAETKGFLIGAHDFAISKGAELANYGLNILSGYTSIGLNSFVQKNICDFSKKELTNHYGIDLSLGVNEQGIDKFGHKSYADGEHGHFYIYYKKPTADSAGAILMGIEGSSPDSPHHSKFGASDPFSPSYGSLWESLDKKERPDEYKDCAIGGKYNGRKITLSQYELNHIVNIDVQNLSSQKLATSVPTSSVEDFLKQNLNFGICAEVTEEIVPNIKSSISSEFAKDSDLTLNIFDDYFDWLPECNISCAGEDDFVHVAAAAA